MKTLIITGHFGREVEARYTPAGKLVATVSVAVTTGFGDNKETEWIKATFWEKSAEIIRKLTRKGTKVLLTGTPKVEAWIGKDKEAHAQINLNVRDFEILAGFADKDEDQSTPYDEYAPEAVDEALEQ